MARKQGSEQSSIASMRITIRNSSTLPIKTTSALLPTRLLKKLSKNSSRLTISKQVGSIDPLKTKALSSSVTFVVKSTLRATILRSKLMFRERGSIHKTQGFVLSMKARAEEVSCSLLIMRLHCLWEMAYGQFILSTISPELTAEFAQT